MKTILKYIDIGKQEGARLVAGGKRKPGKGCFMENTVFADVTNQMRLAREEVSQSLCWSMTSLKSPQNGDSGRPFLRSISSM